MNATLAALIKKHGGEVGSRLDTMRPVQRQEIAEAAYELGVIQVMDALNVPIESLERALRAAGFEKCAGECEAWFGALELTEGKCPDCNEADGFYERQRELKERDEWIEAVAALGGAEKLTQELRTELLAWYAEGIDGPTAVERLEAKLQQAEPVGPSGN